jgi:hypothetical protein
VNLNGAFDINSGHFLPLNRDFNPRHAPTYKPPSQASQLVSSRSLKLRRVRAVDGRLKASGA